MSSTLPPTNALPPFAGAPTEPLWRLSVDQYHEMIRSGILTEDDRVELLDGLLLLKMTKNPEHCFATDHTRDALEAVVPSGWHVRTQDPVVLDTSEPEPDNAVVRGRRGDYRTRHPAATDIGLVQETSDKTVGRDRGVKKSIYAAAAIPVYWIVNLVARQVEVYTDPTGAVTPDYRQCTIYGSADEVPVILDGHEVGRVKVSDLLP